MAMIYKITNTFVKPNKSYVGMTKRSLGERFDEHVSSGRNIRGAIELAVSLREYGTLNHKIEILEECDDNIALERESFWIEKLNTISEGYNVHLSFIKNQEKEYWGDKELAKLNIENGYVWNKGISPYNLFRDKISKTKKERYILGLYNNSYGHRHSHEVKMKLSKVLKEQYAKGRKNSQALYYDVLCENNTILNDIDKINIQKLFNLTDKDWKTLTKWCRDCENDDRLHPKFKIKLRKKGKIYDDKG